MSFELTASRPDNRACDHGCVSATFAMAVIAALATISCRTNEPAANDVTTTVRPHDVRPTGTDSDGDGISDDRDACPYEAGASSNDPKTNGCVQQLDVPSIADRTPTRVFFPKSSSSIPSENDARIDDVVATLRHTPGIGCVEVTGHASSDEHAAQRLSEERANAVRARIVLAGIDPKHLVAKAGGSSSPRTEAPEGNRFVEFRIIAIEAAGSCPNP